MSLLGAVGNCCELYPIRSQGVALVHAAGIPQHPGVDPEFFGRADLLADLVRCVARFAAAERERLEVRTNRRGSRERARALEDFSEGAANDAIWLAVRPCESVTAFVVVARIDHR